MRKMPFVTSTAVAVLMGGAALAPAAGAAEISSSQATVATHAPSHHRVKTRRVCKRVVTHRHHRRHVKVVCHTVRRHY
jgi:hypothetical protein